MSTSQVRINKNTNRKTKVGNDYKANNFDIGTVKVSNFINYLNVKSKRKSYKNRVSEGRFTHLSPSVLISYNLGGGVEMLQMTVNFLANTTNGN